MIRFICTAVISMHIFLFLAAGRCYALFDLDIGLFGASAVEEGYNGSFLFGSLAGGGLGAGVDIKKLGPGMLQARLDVTGFSWGESDFTTLITGISVKNNYTRNAVFTGARFYSPKLLFIRVYLDGGAELSMDKRTEEQKDLPDVTESELNFGVSVGGGVVMNLLIFRAGIQVRKHVIKDDYLSYGPFASLRF